MISRMHFVILGAGRPFQGTDHTALRSAFGQSRVLDWLLHSVAFLDPRVHFVGGYQFDAIAERYPAFQYTFNREWENSRAAYSFLQVPFNDSNECLVSYADILFRETLVKAMVDVDADIVVAVDTHWRNRFSGRTAEQLQRCEKVFLHSDNITRLDSDIDTYVANAEFVGCVRFGIRALKKLNADKKQLAANMRDASLSDLVEYLRIQGFSVKAADARADWAEMDAPQDLAHFILGTKAQTLDRLRGMVKLSRIEQQVNFTVGDWRADNQGIIARIQKQFPRQVLVIRSSALTEDGFSQSNAGAYTSVLNINGDCQETLAAGIERVIASYADKEPDNQVLIQPMLSRVMAAGVIFTRTLTGSAPYYVVNYDDMSGSTESITTGSCQDHKTLIMRRDASDSNPNIPSKLSNLLPALREIEALLEYDALDIEFAMSKEGIHILQVRPIAGDNPVNRIDDKDVIALLYEAEKQFDRLAPPSPFIAGKRALYGVMPDWNPAEIIGTKPGRLAMSLYRFLIMDEAWAAQRAEYGYRDVRPQPLLVSFAGQPYIDVRASFNSFVPAGLDEHLTARLVEFYLDWLERHPHLHDKIEFDVVPTCYALDFSRWEKRLMEEGGFSAREVATLRDALKAITIAAFDRNEQDFAAVRCLEQRFDALKKADLPHLEKAWLLLQDCRSLGTLPFAHMARSAFIAVTLLKSAVSSRVISKKEMDDFMNTIRTVSHEIIEDAQAASEGQMDWMRFVDKYGHLRPGTYDITSLSYASAPEFYLRPFAEKAGNAFEVPSQAAGELWAGARDRFAAALRKSGLKQHLTKVETFMREAIEGREYSKFAFTRNLSLALDEIALWGEALGLDRKTLSYISIEDILAFRTGSVPTKDMAEWLFQRADEGMGLHANVTAIELPPLITNRNDFSVFLYPASQPNYIGQSRIIAGCLDLEQIEDNVDLTGKIALIPRADPGYDWLFGRNIAGLITMYGGANSHMAIRAAEFGMPAAIGVGEMLYQKLAAASVIELNPGGRQLGVVS